jgi:hypothetical protein
MRADLDAKRRGMMQFSKASVENRATTSDGEGSANSSANSSANPSRSSSSLKLSELDGAAGVSADAVSQRLRALEPKEEVLDSPFAQLLALRSQAATLPPLPSSSLGRGALMPAIANFQSQVSYSRSMAGSATR